jgi:hypothetical protein
MIKVMLVCDSCGAIIASGISANAIRFDAQALYRRYGAEICVCGVPTAVRLFLLLMDRQSEGRA